MNAVIQEISAYAVVVTTVGGAVAIICKPVREGIKKLFGKREDKLMNKLDAMDKKVDKLSKEIEETTGKLEILSAKVDATADEVKTVSAKNDENEADRLKGEIFRYGNIARRGQHISSEEFRHLQEVFQKYSVDLGKNGIGKQEYDLVADYYNHRGWEPQK